MGEMKILRVGLLSEIHNLEPKEAQDTDSMLVLRQFLESPFEVRPGGTEVEPILFTGSLVKTESGDLPVYRGTVRQDLKFSNGETMTTTDVVNCLTETALVREQAEISQDGNDVVFGLKKPNARFDITLSHVESAVCRRVGGEFIGTGPFRMLPNRSPRELRLERNPYYRQPVALDEVHFVTYPLDAGGKPTALVRALETGEVDLTTVLPRDEISELTGVRKSFQPGMTTALLYLNMDRPKLRDARVRRAIAHAIDRLAITESTFSNALAFKANSLIPRRMEAVTDRLVFDLARSRELLAEPDVVAPDRLTLLEIWGPRPYLPNPRKVTEILQSQLAELGIEVEVVETTSSQDYFAKIAEGTCDLTLAGWTADTLDPSDFLESNLASERVPTRENLAVSANHSRLRSPAMDQALLDYRGDRSPERLTAIMDLLYDEAPVVPLMYGAAGTVMSFKVLNFRPSPLGVFSMADLDLRS